MTIRVATWNVHEGSADTSGAAFEPWIHVQDLGLDLLALQEVPFDDGAESRMLSAMKAHTGLAFASVLPLAPSIYGHDASGLAILSRYPLSSESSRFFASDGHTIVIGGKTESVHEKAVSRAVSRTPLGEILTFNLHLFPFNRMKVKASEEQFDGLWSDLREELATKGDGAAIVFGDFNTPERELAIDADSGFSRVVGDRITHEGFASDDILVSPHFRVRSTQLLENPSDHLLCVAELAVHSPG